ncbi:MAG: hypothetical protein RLZ96_432 [Actinomycetota bacterium]
MLVPLGTQPPVLCRTLRYGIAIDSLVQVTQLGCLSSPNWSVASRLPTECVGNFMQQDLLNLMNFGDLNQMP